MSNPYPNESASSIYTHLRTLSNTIGDLGDIVSSLQFSASITELTDPAMPSSGPPGSLRRRFLRIISFGRYSSHSADDTERLIKTYDAGRRHSAPPNLNIDTNRPSTSRNASAIVHDSPQSSDSAQTTIHYEVSKTAVPFMEAFRNQHPVHYAVVPDFDTTTETETEAEREQTPRDSSPRPLTRFQDRRHNFDRVDPAHIGHIHCENCGGFWEYNHIYCPRCAGRTLRHDYGTGGQEPATTNDAETGESTWHNNADGPIAGTVEESWATTTTSAADTSPSSKVHISSRLYHEPAPDPRAEPSSAVDPSLCHVHPVIDICCRGVSYREMVPHCCCAQPCTHNIDPVGDRFSKARVRAQPCCTLCLPITAAVGFGGPVPAMPMSP
ncbi:hypothetical protein D6D01_03597 [Aureobasidium pullulans]|uniref:Uncharacterized protein n=1 Tax=Aureobasidium pullulans TaxID=5580 RepID=A0A4S9LIB7_AURPU|nr:hypothetical protein D6D01_03597 [Aureobasidium pullulans]